MTPNQLLELSRQLHVVTNTVKPSWSEIPPGVTQWKPQLAGVDGSLKIAIASAIASLDEDLLTDALAHFADDLCGFYPAYSTGDLSVTWRFDFAPDRSTVVIRPTNPEVRS